MDILRGVDVFGKVWEEGEIPIVIIGDKDNEDEICVSIYITTTGIVSRYYYKGLSFIDARDIWKYFSDLNVDYNKTNIPDIPKAWRKRSTHLQTKTGSLQPMKDEFINIVEKATKLQCKMKF